MTTDRLHQRIRSEIEAAAQRARKHYEKQLAAEERRHERRLAGLRGQLDGALMNAREMLALLPADTTDAYADGDDLPPEPSLTECHHGIPDAEPCPKCDEPVKPMPPGRMGFAQAIGAVADALPVEDEAVPDCLKEEYRPPERLVGKGRK